MEKNNDENKSEAEMKKFYQATLAPGESEDDDPEPEREGVTSVLIDDEMKRSYINYAMSVIVGRALPDARTV